VQAKAGDASIESTGYRISQTTGWRAISPTRSDDAQLDHLPGLASLSRLQRDPEVEGLVATRRANLETVGMFAEKSSPQRRDRLLRVGVDGFSSMTFDQQLAVWVMTGGWWHG